MFFHPRRIKRIFRAVDGHERALAAFFYKAVAAAVFLVFKRHIIRKAEAVELLFYKTAEYAAKPHRGDKRHFRPRSSEDIGDVVGAAANHKALAVRVQILLRFGQVIDPDDHIHTGRTENERIFHRASHSFCMIFAELNV